MSGALHADMDLSGLTRRHGVTVAGFPCSVKECGLAVGRVVCHDSVKSAACMSGGVVMFLDSTDKAKVVSGVEVSGALVSVMSLSTPAVWVTVSNVPPFIRDEALARELARHGKVVSHSSVFRSQLLRHVVSHRRQLLMLLNDRSRTST